MTELLIQLNTYATIHPWKAALIIIGSIVIIRESLVYFLGTSKIDNIVNELKAIKEILHDKEKTK